MSSEDLPEIPKEWNLTEEQRASMIEAQRKTIATDNKRRAIQQEIFNKYNEHASMKPSEFPIIVNVKENNQITKEFNLMDSDDNFIYAKSFDDATTKVKNAANNPKSELVKMYKKSDQSSNKLRISSDNKKSPAQTNKFSLLPNGNYKYWEIIATNAPASMMSSFRKTIQNKSKGGRTKRRRTNKIKKNKIKTKKRG